MSDPLPLEDVLPSFQLDKYMIRTSMDAEDELAVPPGYSETATEGSSTLNDRPESSTETIFAELNRHHKLELPVDIEIHITKEPPKLSHPSEPEDPSRRYFPGELITGYCTVTNRRSSEIPFTTLLVSLEGAVETPGHVRHTLLRTVDLASSYHPGDINLKMLGGDLCGKRDERDGTCYGFCKGRAVLPYTTHKKFFHFVVPPVLLDTTCSHQLEPHLNLPPSAHDFLGGIEYNVTVRVVGEKTADGICYEEKTKEVLLGTKKSPVSLDSTARQLAEFQKTTKNLISDLKGEHRRKASYIPGEEQQDDVSRYRKENLYLSHASIDLPTKLIGGHTYTMAVTGSTTRNHTLSDCHINLTLSTEHCSPPGHVSIVPKLREIYVSSRKSLPISIDEESLLKGTFSGRQLAKLKTQNTEDYQEIRKLAIETNTSVPSRIYHGLYALSSLLCNERTVKNRFETLQREPLNWRYDEHSGKYEAHLDLPIKYTSATLPGSSFQTCYLGRWYQIVLVIKINKRIVDLVLPLNVD